MYSLETIIALNNPKGVTADELKESARPKTFERAIELNLTADDLKLLAGLKISTRGLTLNDIAQLRAIPRDTSDDYLDEPITD